MVTKKMYKQISSVQGSSVFTVACTGLFKTFHIKTSLFCVEILKKPIGGSQIHCETGVNSSFQFSATIEKVNL